VRKLREHYVSRLAEKEEHARLDWEDAYSHRKRFEVLIDHVPLAHKTLLDVGCGVGSLYRFLRDRGIECSYIGVDVLPEMVEMARGYSPEATFLVGDPFHEDLVSSRSVDVVYASGVFNLNIGHPREFLYEAVDRMRTWARETVVFNALHCRSHCQENSYVYYDPEEVIETLKSRYPDRLTLVDDYLINDFTIVLEKSPRSL